MHSGNDLLLLQDLLNINSQNDDEEYCTTSNSSTGPADITPKKPEKLYKSPYEKVEVPKAKEGNLVDPNDETIFELKDESDNGVLNWKITPEWNVSYRQSVTPNDVFLQMGGKNPSTASCEEMIIKVLLPGECRQNVNLKIEEKSLDLVSPRFKLLIPLPQPVDPQRGNAEFDNNTQTLMITLKMRREFDYINF